MAGHIWDGQGPRYWGMTRDDDGHREYKLRYRVEMDDPTDGPATALATPGLPAYGDRWDFGNEVDLDAWCRHNVTVIPVLENKPNLYFDLEFTYSTKPTNRTCEDPTNKNPLLEPMKLSGRFVKYTEEADYDRFGEPILNSAHEIMHGPNLEFDANRPSVRIEQNSLELDLDFVSLCMDCLNDQTMWGFPPRCVKLSAFSWEKRYHGSIGGGGLLGTGTGTGTGTGDALCQEYYVRVFDLDINPNTFDRDIADEGTKCIRGKWDTDPASATFRRYIIPDGIDRSNPANFIRFKDFHGENIRGLLDGHGFPVGGLGEGTDGGTGTIHVEKYYEINLFLLGLPTTL